MTSYAELQCTSNFSFLRGASHPEEIAMQAKHLGLAALAVTDRNTLAGVVRAHAAAKDAELPFIVGTRLDLQEPGISFLAYPTNRQAYGALCRLLSMGQRRAEKGQCLITLEDVYAHAPGMIFALLSEGADRLSGIRKRLKAPLYLAVSHQYRGDDKERINRLAELAQRNQTGLVATNDVLYHHASRRVLQDVVTAIREGVTIAEAGYLLEANAERHLKTPEEMGRLFRDHPSAIANTLAIAKACRFSLEELKYEYPEEPIPQGSTPQAHLTHLAWEGAKERYPDGIPPKVRENIAKELALIEKLNYAPYFLTVHDIVHYARTQDPPILAQGRGSAANSTVCYVIGITAVDPNQIELLFERFISEERKEPPDIDVDFEHERREQVIQYIYQRYGRERAGLAATVITYRGRSAMREVGKAMGLSEDLTATLAGIVWGQMREEMHNGRLKEAGLDPDDPLLAKVIGLADDIQGFPRHLSQHVGGFVLTKGRLDETVPIGNAAMEGRTFIEWDKDDIDTLGILKVDVLALGMLTCIQKSFEMMEAWYGLKYSLATLPREDKAVYDMLCKADSVGVFQVESRAQMNMLPRLKPQCFYDLVIEVAIVRPGPIQGDMVHPYLRRRDGIEPEDYPAPHPDFGPPDELRQVLGRTRGVPLFQEQAMKLAMVAAEFTAGELNELRKAMATFRRRGTIGRLEQKMVSRMVERGYDAAFAARCFSQIKGFGEYGFPESHAASFAHLVYVSSWLKHHYPEVFAAALLNSQPMGFYAPAQIVRDAREHGVEVRPVDVSHSRWDSIMETPSRGERAAMRLGFREVDGLRAEDVALLLQYRSQKKPMSIADLHGFGVPVAGLERLAAADCFRSLGLDRRASLWEVKALTKAKALPLFAFAGTREQGEEAHVALPGMPLSEHVVNDYQTLKLSLKAHPMQFLRRLCAGRKVTDTEKLKTLRNGAPVTVAGVVLVRQRPGSAKGVVFLTLEDEFSVCNAVIWPQVLETCRAVVMGARLMLIKGRVQRTGGIIHVVAGAVEDHSDWLALLTEEGTLLRNPLARADEVARPGPDPHQQQPPARHPRQVRVIPKSRDFH
ncbi:MAG: error-prone DNA polymerase [Aestuariivirga sp.]|uniref:error-prone DNA polymerase n=1 Tax=Aestuariivirga sp. TaxID=2650926 RepID=UPI0025C045F8|nr:error-prone DNA polymerase [Aestuariivirga sp.]MCA3560223.1 error-prone DNA polymerase [Aestuariivirga sp.]